MISEEIGIQYLANREMSSETRVIASLISGDISYDESTDKGRIESASDTDITN
jgi:hypothetical protein